jgi:hypothetical protein
MALKVNRAEIGGCSCLKVEVRLSSPGLDLISACGCPNAVLDVIGYPERLGGDS